MNLPRLRFPEFQDAPEWDLKPLDKICEIKGGKRIPKGFSLTNEKTDYPYVRVSDMYMGGIDTSSVLYVPSEIEKQIRNYKISKNDLFITVAGTIGIVGEVPEELDNANLTENANKIVLKSIGKKYLLHYLTGESAQQLISSSVTNNAQPKLALERIRLFPIPVPSPEEQQKIADCLSSIDDLITAQTRKLDTLKTHKKGLMQQLFPAEGETLPKLRFPEYQDAGEWERKKLGEVISLEYGGSLSEQNRKDGTIPVIGSNGVVGYHDQHLVKGPVIVIGRKGSAGQVNWISSDCYPIDTTFYVRNKGTNDYLMSFLMLILEGSNLLKLKDNGAVPGLNRHEVYSIKSTFPKFQEQQKIADCLSSIADLITAQTQKLATLKTHKKALMQQLFPALEEVSS